MTFLLIAQKMQFFFRECFRFFFKGCNKCQLKVVENVYEKEETCCNISFVNDLTIRCKK